MPNKYNRVGKHTQDVDFNDGMIGWQARNSYDASDWLSVVTWRERHLVGGSLGAVLYWAQTADTVQRHRVRQHETACHIGRTDQHLHFRKRKSSNRDAPHCAGCSLDESGAFDPCRWIAVALTPAGQSTPVVWAGLTRCQQRRTVIFDVEGQLCHRSWNK